MTPFFFAVLSMLSIPFTWAAPATPPAPNEFISDPAQLLPEPLRQTWNQALAHHDHIEGEEIIVALYSDQESSDPQPLYRQWKLGHRGGSKGFLLLINTQTQTIGHYVGYALEEDLTSTSNETLLDRAHREWQTGLSLPDLVSKILLTLLGRIDSPALTLPPVSAIHQKLGVIATERIETETPSSGMLGVFLTIGALALLWLGAGIGMRRQFVTAQFGSSLPLRQALATFQQKHLLKIGVWHSGIKIPGQGAIVRFLLKRHALDAVLMLNTRTNQVEVQLSAALKNPKAILPAHARIDALMGELEIELTATAWDRAASLVLNHTGESA